MNTNQEYSINFGQGGLVVRYEDASGSYVFTLDIDGPIRKGAKEKLILESDGVPYKNKKPWPCDTPEDQEQLALMLNRVERYLLSLGFDFNTTPRRPR